MKKVLPLLITFFFGAGIGAATIYLILSSSSQKTYPAPSSNLQSSVKPHGFEKYFDRTFDRDFFQRGQEPFQEMKKIRERMRDLFDEDQFDKRFDHWYDMRFGGKIGEIESREDANFFIYEISIQDIDPESLKLEVVDGQLSVQGEVHKEENGVAIKTSFMRSFPLPQQINTQAMSSEIINDKLIIKFPKFNGDSI